MKKHYVCIIVVVMALALFFTILNINKYISDRFENTKPTIFYMVNDEGEIEYLTENAPEVIMLKDIITNHALAVDTRTFEGIDFSKEYEFYSDEFKNIVMRNEINIRELYQQNKLVTEHYDIVFKRIEFIDQMTKAEVLVTDQYKFLEVYEGSELYVYKGTIFNQERRYILELMNGIWKIVDIKTDREE